MESNYFNVTERPGHNATKDQLSMMLTRYNLAGEYISNKKVLEIACGAGMGLGYLAEKAATVVGGDIDARLVDIAKNSYQENKEIEILELDAHALPFSDNSFDVVLLYEAIYYLKDIEKALAEVKRILTPSGRFIISTVNKEWHGFNPSPHSVRYYSLDKLNTLLKSAQFKVENKVGFYDEPAGSNAFTSTIRKVAVSLNLIPKTMEGKERLKRLFYGKLTPIPAVIFDGIAPLEPLLSIDNKDNLSNYKFLYVIGEKLN